MLSPSVHKRIERNNFRFKIEHVTRVDSDSSASQSDAPCDATGTRVDRKHFFTFGKTLTSLHHNPCYISITSIQVRANFWFCQPCRPALAYKIQLLFDPAYVATACTAAAAPMLDARSGEEEETGLFFVSLQKIVRSCLLGI